MGISFKWEPIDLCEFGVIPNSIPLVTLIPKFIYIIRKENYASDCLTFKFNDCLDFESIASASASASACLTFIFHNCLNFETTIILFL